MTNYLFSNQTGPSFNGTQYFFRTVTEYKKDSSGRVTDSIIYVYYTPSINGKSRTGETWSSGSNTSLDNFKQGGFVLAATSTNRGTTFTTKNYTKEDSDAGRIPIGKNVGDPILGASAVSLLNTRGEVFNEAIQNSVINTAVNTEPGLASQLSVKAQNTQNQQNPDNIPRSTVNPITRKRKAPDRVVPEGEYLSYPLNLGDMDKIKFRALKIDKGDYSSQFNDGQTVGDFLSPFKPIENTYIEADGPVYIGIQAPISDQNSVRWGDGNLNAIDAYLYKKALGLIGTPDKDIPTELGKIGEEIFNITKQSNEEILRLVAGMAAGMNDILPRVSAQILNPNLELLFQGPQLRPFNFTFNLIAYDKEESDIIKKIIKFFKQNMAVQKTENYLFLRAPHVFEIRYMSKGKNGEQDHQSINLITGDSTKTENAKACALLNCSVDYTPLGSYMTFQDEEKSMVQYTLNLQFQEITPVYDEDYTSPEHPIGF